MIQEAERLQPQSWMTAAETQRVMQTLNRDGARALFVGGCVRDAILGRPVKDIDIATELPPEQVIEKLEAAGVHTVPTGLSHGTVTAVAPGGDWDHFEITTLRVDVQTYGRHAQVAFTDDWEADARRRDFTINVIFCDADGRVFDPVGGLADLRAGLVRFVGEPVARIREDVLRVLRFFRLHAYYGQGAPDPAALEACTALADLLPDLSGERVAGEVLRTLQAPDPAGAFDLMARTGVLRVILPEAGACDRLRALVPLESEGVESSGLRRLAAVLQTDRAGIDGVADRLRLSNRERTRLRGAVTVGWSAATATENQLKELLYRRGAERYTDTLLLTWAEHIAGGRAGDEAPWRAALALPLRWTVPEFPLQGRDVLALGVAAGPPVGDLLEEAEQWWIGAGFEPDRAACLDWLRARVASA